MEGTCKTSSFSANLDFIKSQKGATGVDEVMEHFKESKDYFDFKGADRVPMAARVAFLRSVKDALGWEDSQFYEMGRHAVNESYILKHTDGLYPTPEGCFRKASEMWDENYSQGRMLNAHYEEGRAVTILENIDLGADMCAYIGGFLSGLGTLTEEEDFKTVEVKCKHKGDSCHEFVTTWKV